MLRIGMLALALIGRQEAPEAAEFERIVRPFLKGYCVECHGERVRKADLRLDVPSPDWRRVLEVLRDGAMPPPKKAQPPAADRDAVVSRLTQALSALEVERARVSGRTVLRRLNRVEYEHTLRDLLALPDLHVRDMLPADGEAHGFDTVADALQLSEVQIARYLEASAYALEQAMAVRARPEVPSVQRRAWEAGRLPPTIPELGVAGNQVFVLVPPTAAQSPWRDGLQITAAGTYRFRLSCFGAVWDQGQVKPADRSHVLSFYAHGSRKSASRWLATVDVPADRPGIVEFTGRMEAGWRLDLVPETLRGGAVKDPSRHSGPAIGLEFLDIEGPFPEAWPPESHRRLFGDPPRADAERLLKSFIERAFRRPALTDEVQPYVALAREELEARQPFHEAMKVAFQAVLCAPDFLFRFEAPGRLDGFALASRLSYFLWSSMPDAELLSVARDGRLDRPDVLRAQVDRMLGDVRARRFVEEFAGQWLDLRRIEATQPDRQLYPDYDLLLLRSMIRETHEYLHEMLREDLGVSHLVDADFVFVNGRLARHYGIAGVDGVELRRVPRPAGSPRGGLLAQAAILKVTANGTTTSPVTRGAWVLDRILGKPAPPPPAEVPAVEPDLRGAVTIREQLAKHRNVPECASCHVRIDPPGFALESFDVIGGWQDRYRSLEKGDRVDPSVHGRHVRYRLGLPVDPTGDIGGRPFRDVRELKAILLEDRAALARNLAQRLIVYATGAGVGISDRPVVEEILARTRPQGHGLRSMIHEIVQCRLFLNK